MLSFLKVVEDEGFRRNTEVVGSAGLGIAAWHENPLTRRLLKSSTPTIKNEDCGLCMFDF